MAKTMNAIIKTHRSALAACDSEDDPGGPLNTAERQAWKAFVAAPCGTAEHVQAKVAYVADSERLSGWVDDGMDDPLGLLRSLRLPIAPADPLLALVTAYHDTSAVYDAKVKTTSDADERALAVSTWVPHYAALRDEPPTPTTMPGVVAGLRLALSEQEEQCEGDNLTANMLRAVLAFLDVEAA